MYPVFHSGLSKEQSHQIEIVQKKAFAVILGRQYESYEIALDKPQLDRLDNRRSELCYKFALKCTLSAKHSGMFPRVPAHNINLRNPKLFDEPKCKTSRYYNSPVPYLSRLLNAKSKKM